MPSCTFCTSNSERCEVAERAHPRALVFVERLLGDEALRRHLARRQLALERVPLEERGGALLVERIVVEDAPGLLRPLFARLDGLGLVARGEGDHAIEHRRQHAHGPITAGAR